jgi:uncharacterized coiled-coil protein SlyX
MIDKFLQKQGVGIALFFIVIELAYVNTLSLEYMFDNEWIYDVIFGIIGAIGFSIVTVLVMRLSRKEWLKHIFPVFDAVLMFCGFNLKHWDDLFDNPVRFAMSIFLSAFSGLITYSLGQINAEQHNDSNDTIVSLRSNVAEQKQFIDKQQTIINDLTEKNKDIQRNLNESLKLVEEYKPGFVTNRLTNIRKKLEKNRTPEEQMFLEQYSLANN